jgi:hypothetical protein
MPQSLSPIDVRGIREGQVYEGMTKKGVVFAIGYPPRHANPTLAANRWLYWKTRHNKIAIYFEDGLVNHVQD